MLTRIEVRRLELPLTTPYHLSFGDVKAFDTVLVRLHDDQGRMGIGEATVLTGYTDETIDQTWAEAQQLADAWCRLPGAELLQRARALGPRAPFLATAFASAAEMLHGADVLAPPAALSVPVLGAINDTEPDAMRAQIDALCARGFRTLKIKVGNDWRADAERVAAARAHVAGRALLRVDANQGFSPADARAFAHQVGPEGIELFEQPCAAGDWAAHMAVATDCPLPLMLDESIYDEADIDRVAERRAACFVKVKLMKFVSLERLAAAIERIRAHGLEPVLGNGVASDIGCWMEVCVAARHIRNAGEMNGWTRQRRPLLTDPLQVHEGLIRVPAGWRPQVDEAALDAGTVAVHVASGAA
ncbi:MAG: enolase C-terminal domain-like protein [Rubrivivax sp.]